MLLTKTFVAAAAIAGALLASPPTAAAQRRPEPPPWPAPQAQHSTCTVVPPRQASLAHRDHRWLATCAQPTEATITTTPKAQSMAS
jgi:hypothetical protein